MGIETLVKDIYSVVEANGGWDSTIDKLYTEETLGTIRQRLSPEAREHHGTLRMSNVGAPCKRQLWYRVNKPDEGIPLLPNARLKFLYGDILETLLINLARASGHDVQGCQTELKVGDIVGHRDCVIDGITVDVKSASPYSFKKFKEGNLRSDDPFGYISQLSSYVYAGRGGEVPTSDHLGAFLVIDKVNGHICLDMHDFTEELKTKEQEIEEAVALVKEETPPPLGFHPIPEGKSGNMKLGLNCSYCDFRLKCYPNLQTFAYANGPVHLAHVARPPTRRDGSPVPRIA